MRSFLWSALLFSVSAQAQTTVTICESYNYTAISTFFEYETFYISVDALGVTRTIATSLPSARTTTRSTGGNEFTSMTSNTVSNGGISNSRTTLRSTTRIPASENVPGNGTSVIIPDNTIAPTTPIPTSLTTTSSTTMFGESTLSTTTRLSTSTTTSGTLSSYETSSSTTYTTLSTSSNLFSSSSTTSTTIETTEPSDSTTTTTETTAATSSSTATPSGPVVTNKAYIDTILRHHNQHRLNHTSPTLSWNPTLAKTARKIADSCIYQHDTATDCTPNESCYGQNIGAGYLPTQMSFLISDGFYNSEVNSYTYYGGEPDLDTLHEWGHFSQIVWKIDTQSVGCYTMDCTGREGGLVFPRGGGQGIRAFFTVCNYGGPGNWVDEFTDNVIEPIGLSTIKAGYLCPTLDNCEDGAVL